MNRSSCPPGRHCLLLFLLLLPCLLPAQAPATYDPEPSQSGVEVRSFHLPMRDSVQIAVDLLLPKDREPGQTFPTILHQTRYWRALDLRWPFSGLIDAGAPSMWIIASTTKLVEQGYAILSVDARGTGASTGRRTMEASPDEIKDAREIMDWIVDQPWSDGKIGTMGVSYNGWVSLMTASLGHPALKCAVPISAPFDGFREMTLPGGVYNRHLVRRWTDICHKMDHDTLPSSLTAKWLYVQGIPLLGKGSRKKQLDQLYAERATNQYADDFMKRIPYRDTQLPELGTFRIDSIFPAGHYDQINRAQVPIYAFAGWYDLSAGFGATRILLSSTHPESKLLLGAWHHASRKRVSPFSEVVDIQFDRYGELLKFFDHHLKGLDNGISEEPRIHYYHMGEEGWRHSEAWPLRTQRKQILYLGADSTLANVPPESDGGQDACFLEADCYTGWDTRWELGSESNARYDTFLTREPEFLRYTSAPVPEARDVTGFPQVTLYMQVPDPQANVFVYLEDVAPDGTRRVMSQGQVKVGFRKIHPGPGPYQDAVGYRRFFREDWQDIDPTGITELPIQLHPTSWRLEKGHAVRLVICGSDLPHFETLAPTTYATQVFRTRTHASRLELPLVPPSRPGRAK